MPLAQQPLWFRIISGPLLALVLLGLVDLTIGVRQAPYVTLAVSVGVALAWIRVLWPDGFRRRQ